jgi:RND family efflux transporter MFP subunit
MKKGSFYKVVRVILVLVAAVLLAGALVKFKPEPERRAPVDSGRLVEVWPARSQSVTLTIESYGTVQPQLTLKLVAEVRGQIVKRHPAFEEGGYVAEGDELIVIDPRDYALEVESRRAQIRQTSAELERLDMELRNLEATMRIAESDVALARSELERLRNLAGRQVVAQSVADQTEQKYLASLERLQGLENQKALIPPRRELLKAQRSMTEVMLRQAQLNLERTRIKAAFDGWVLEKLVEVGQHVTAGQVVGTIYQAGSLEIEVSIPLSDMQWLPAGFSAENPVTAEVIYEEAAGIHRWPGRVIRQKAQMDAATRTLALVVAVDPAADGKQAPQTMPLRPGMFVKVEIAGRAVADAFLLPRYVVYPGDVVYTVVEDRLHVQPVRVLRAYKDEVIVDEGIGEGDLIIRTPLSAGAEGMKVRIQERP